MCPLRAPLGSDSLSDLLPLMTLTVLRASQTFFRTSLSEAHRGEGPFSSRPVRGACCHVTYTVDADLGHLAQVCLSGLSAVQLLPPSPLSSGRRSPCTPRTQGGGTLRSPPRGRSVCRTTWILSQSRFLFPRFLINHLVMSVWTRGCLLYTSGHDPIRLCSVAEPAPALALGSSLGWLRCPPATPIHGGWYFFALPYFLALSGAPGSCWVFPAVLERNPHYFLYARLWSMQLHIKKYTWQTAS